MAGKIVEITEEELLSNRRAAATLEAMMNNKAARKKVLLAHKDIAPNVPIPELDNDDTIETRLSEQEKRFEERVKKFEDEREKEKNDQRTSEMNRRWEAGRKALKTSHRYTDDGLKAVEELMEQKGILDHEDGRVLFEAIHPPQTPLTPNGGNGPWNFFDQPEDGSAKYLEDLMKTKGESSQVVDKAIRDSLNEVRGQR